MKFSRKPMNEWDFKERCCSQIWKHFAENNPMGYFQVQIFGPNAIKEAPILKSNCTGTILTVPECKRHLGKITNMERLQLFCLQRLHPSSDDLELMDPPETNHYKPTFGVKVYSDVLSFKQPHKRLVFIGIDLITKTVTSQWNNIIKEITFDDDGYLTRVELYQPVALVCNSEAERNTIWRPLFQRSGPERDRACRLLEQAANLTTGNGEDFNEELSTHLQALIGTVAPPICK